MWYDIYLSYATYCIRTNDNNIVVETPPIARWMIGRNINYIKRWVKMKNGKIVEMNEQRN